MKPKFRAWDSLENKMRYDIGVIEFNAFDKNVSALAFNHHLDDTGYGEVDNSQSEYYDALCFKLMQYTGLKDKNGKEIYEGDILKWLGHHGHGWQATIYGFITYEKEQARFRLNEDNNEYYEDIYRISKIGEVVGNIYENPELLERSSE
ncbi:MULTISPECIES: hypothetical protein [Staphylococcus]|uniref:YopX protein n=1 Tax=Staphylococcus simulans TaxID=1286 RepID=A0A6N2YMF1_STASI|nr:MULTISPECIES: YopX family protein [Staphylococcus]MBO0387012.1 hypothetical protein [Staphylococcus simulans]MDK7927655.1 YopX family protein [Staphylococcus simulans]MDK8316321.1 YopX family protein [Staphylococcus simulans]OHR48121.1 hypothetical protein HMPREF2951_11710 [Staphylococcus sp. HMSC056D08]OHS49074.1 hypothetical protein HMPREF3270_10125 [Staphylococcus sp. HMSC65H10]